MVLISVVLVLLGWLSLLRKMVWVVVVLFMVWWLWCGDRWVLKMLMWCSRWVSFLLLLCVVSGLGLVLWCRCIVVS